MRSQISAREWSEFFRGLAQRRWRATTREQRFLAAQRASRVRWARFVEWRGAHPAEAAAAAAIAKVIRTVRRSLLPSDDSLVEQLRGKLERVRRRPDFMRLAR